MVSNIWLALSYEKERDGVPPYPYIFTKERRFLVSDLLAKSLGRKVVYRVTNH
jgi:hypothetical protein